MRLRWPTTSAAVAEREVALSQNDEGVILAAVEQRVLATAGADLDVHHVKRGAPRSEGDRLGNSL
jgi:hypothetical protein